MCVCVCVSEIESLLPADSTQENAAGTLADGGCWQGLAPPNAFPPRSPRPSECPGTDWQQAEQHAATGIHSGNTLTAAWHEGRP